MRAVVSVLLGCAVLALGFWAYQENYRTRAATAELRALQQELVALTEERAMLRAEWAWLNRPDRLRALVRANKAALQLMDMTPDHYGHLDQVAYPARSVYTQTDLRSGAVLAQPGSRP